MTAQRGIDFRCISLGRKIDRLKIDEIFDIVIKKKFYNYCNAGK